MVSVNDVEMVVATNNSAASSSSSTISSAASEVSMGGDDGFDLESGPVNDVSPQEAAQDLEPQVSIPSPVLKAVEGPTSLRSSTRSGSFSGSDNGDSKSVKAYYEHQAELVSAFEDDQEKMEAESDDDEDDDHSDRVTRLVRISLVANVVLLALKVVAYLLTGSLAVLAALVDSLLDILSGSMLFVTDQIQNRRNRHKYPHRKPQIEPLGLLIFSMAMAIVNVLVIMEVVDVFIAGELDVELTWISVTALGLVVLTKVVLWVLCGSLKGKSSTIGALAQDHRNDSVANVIGTLAAFLASQNADYWWVDPAVGLLLTLFILYTWGETGVEQIKYLAGVAPGPEVLQRLTRIAIGSHPAVIQIDTLTAFHIGQRLLVECHVVLSPDMRLAEAHEISHCIQDSLEKIELVERAFVHLDVDAGHTHTWEKHL